MGDIQQKYFKYLNENRNKHEYGNVRLVPRKHFFSVRTLQTWVKEFDLKARTYWSAEIEKEQNTLTDDIGRRRPSETQDKKGRYFVMSRQEFCNLPGAMFVSTNQNQHKVHPHFIEAYNHYQEVMRCVQRLKERFRAHVDVTEVKRCSIKFMYDLSRNYFCKYNAIQLNGISKEIFWMDYITK